MKRVLIALAMIAASLFFAAPASAQTPDDDVKRIKICHRTASETNPYGPKAITVSVASIITVPNGHDTHEGPVFPDEGPDGKWGDIIPPFTHENGEYEGKNWTEEGQAIHRNNCQVPGLDDDDDDDDDDDGDGDDDGDDDKAALPATGSQSPWIPTVGALLLTLGISILTRNGSLGSVVGRHVKL